MLYLGAASGTTVSHVSDIVGPVSGWEEKEGGVRASGEVEGRERCGLGLGPSWRAPVGERAAPSIRSPKPHLVSLMSSSRGKGHGYGVSAIRGAQGGDGWNCLPSFKTFAPKSGLLVSLKRTGVSFWACISVSLCRLPG